MRGRGTSSDVASCTLLHSVDHMSATGTELGGIFDLFHEKTSVEGTKTTVAEGETTSRRVDTVIRR